VPQVPRQAIESLRIELPNFQSQIRLADLARLGRRERELMDRLRDARARLFDLAVNEAANRAGSEGTLPGPNATLPSEAGAQAPASMRMRWRL
jgi:hypothetical protein